MIGSLGGIQFVVDVGANQGLFAIYARTLIEEIFGWVKTIGDLHKNATAARTGSAGYSPVAAYNGTRIPKLCVAME